MVELVVREKSAWCVFTDCICDVLRDLVHL